MLFEYSLVDSFVNNIIIYYTFEDTLNVRNRHGWFKTGDVFRIGNVVLQKGTQVCWMWFRSVFTFPTVVFVLKPQRKHARLCRMHSCLEMCLSAVLFQIFCFPSG